MLQVNDSIHFLENFTQDLNLAFEERRRIALEVARDKRDIIITRPIDLVQGGKGFLVYVPLFINDVFDGFVLGVYRVKSFVENKLRDQL